MLARAVTARPFWALQMLAWPTYGLISLIGVLPYIGLEPHLDSVKSVFLSKAAFTMAGFASSSLIRLFYRRENGQPIAWVRIAPAAVGRSYRVPKASKNQTRKARTRKAECMAISLGTHRALLTQLCGTEMGPDFLARLTQSLGMRRCLATGRNQNANWDGWIISVTKLHILD
jgi:hypothetical protein